ncbi:MAG: hypothetical protein KF716_00945 [Anaerolineae bacterium]|nr:hypothetical protein [Anaerolineae bacterium]
MDSTPLRVRHNRRIQRHKVFKGWRHAVRVRRAGTSASSCIWSLNHLGELVAFRLTVQCR